MPNTLQRVLGVAPDGVSMETKKALLEAGVLQPQQSPPPQTGAPIMGSTVDPNATVVLPDGRRVTPAQAAILQEMLRRRAQGRPIPQGR